MRIALDARSYFMRTGIARYTRGLVEGLAAGENPHEWLVLISDRHEPAELGPGSPRVEVRRSTAPWLGGHAERDALSRDVTTWGADLFHAVFPPHGLPRVPTVTTVFDFSPLSHRAVHQPVVRAAFEDAWTSASAHSRGFITLSDATARQVRSRIDGRRPVWRIPAGLSAPFDRPLASATTPRTGVLTVGTIEPRKSIDTVLEAARRLAASGRCVPVTLVGKRGWGYPDFESDLARTPAARWLGYVDDETLLACYQGAAIAAFPSVLEGFGLPVLEAMAQGALPLISADESMTEVVGTSGLQVPGSPEAWADAIGHWLDDDDRRTKMAAQLAERARGFTWAAAARASVQAYEAIA